MVFGRIAGHSAIAHTDSTRLPPKESSPVANEEADVDIAALRSQLQQIMRKDLNVIRCEEDLQEGLALVQDMLCQLGEHRKCYQKYRLYNDLLTAQITLLSALTRKGSIGCHCRADAIAEESAYRVVINKDGENMHARRLSL